MAIYDYQGNEISSGGGSAGYDWNNKKIVFEGDSITANSNIGYPAYVAQKLGATADVIAIAGVPVMGSYPGNNWDIRRRISHIPYNADAIVILGDTNSISSTDANLFSSSMDDWAGRWNLALQAIKKSFPTVPLFLAACFRQGSKDNNAKYVSYAFQRFAEHWGLLYIDLATESSLNLLASSKVWGLTPTDTVHPSHAAMPLYADIVLKHIKETPPFVFSGSDTIAIDATLSVAVGATAEINYEITGDLSIQWTSSNYDVACVMGGTVYGMSDGTATITATTRNGNTATCAVTVTSA